MLRRSRESDIRIDRRDDAAEQDEARLVALVAAGQLPAFDALYRLYHVRLARFVERVTRRPGLVDELRDDTMMVVWRRADSYNGRSKVSTWIFAIAYRKALKALSRLDEPPAPGDGGDLPEAHDTGPGPEQAAQHHRARAALLRALGELSPEQRAVVDLTYFHELGYEEISKIVDCPVGTVKTRMFHARRRLKQLLAGEAGDWL
jgi:RNA polymerase sigma-70 factor (ECF subfamily)